MGTMGGRCAAAPHTAGGPAGWGRGPQADGSAGTIGRNLSNPVTRVGVKESILLVAAGQRVLVLYNGFHQSFIVTAVLEALSVKSI